MTLVILKTSIFWLIWFWGWCKVTKDFDLTQTGLSSCWARCYPIKNIDIFYYYWYKYHQFMIYFILSAKFCYLIICATSNYSFNLFNLYSMASLKLFCSSFYLSITWFSYLNYYMVFPCSSICSYNCYDFNIYFFSSNYSLDIVSFIFFVLSSLLYDFLIS
jgi:hypothetical protein